MTTPRHLARGDGPAGATTRRHGVVSLLSFTLSLAVLLFPALWSGSGGQAGLARTLGILLWAAAFFYAVRAWRELGGVADPTSMTRILGHLPIIVMVATFLALALATIRAG